jgi:type IV fimbrial biogenesis protein FimU
VHKRIFTAGFTLVEMMVVVALLAIMASIAMPSFARLIAANSVEAAGNELYGLLQYARAEAVARGQRVTVSADSSDTWSQALDVSTLNSGAPVTLRHYESLNQSKVTATASTQALSDVAFYSNGSSSGSTLITLCYSPDVTITGKLISIARSGQVSAPQSAVCQ